MSFPDRERITGASLHFVPKAGEGEGSETAGRPVKKIASALVKIRIHFRDSIDIQKGIARQEHPAQGHPRRFVAVLGVAVSALPRSGKSAAAVIIPIVLIPQFISGVYVQFTMLPEWLQNVANLLPLAWIARGMRAAFLPDAFATVETGGAWNLGIAAFVIGGWCLLGFVTARLTFRWIRTDG